jgi:hypothetical protein
MELRCMKCDGELNTGLACVKCRYSAVVPAEVNALCLVCGHHRCQCGLSTAASGTDPLLTRLADDAAYLESKGFAIGSIRQARREIIRLRAELEGKP